MDGTEKQPPDMTPASSASEQDERKPLTREVLGEYISIRDSASHMNDRRDRTSDVFVALNGVFLGGFGLLVFSSHFRSWEAVIEVVGLMWAGMLFNGAWYISLQRYREGLRVHYNVLTDLESQYKFVGNLSTKLDKLPSSPTKASGNFGTAPILAFGLLILYPLATAGVAALTDALTTHHLLWFALPQ